MSMKVNVEAIGLNTVNTFRIIKRKFDFFFNNAAYHDRAIGDVKAVNVVKLVTIIDNRHLLADLTPHDRLSIVVSKVFTVYYSPYGDSYNYVDCSPFWGRPESDRVIGYNLVIQQRRPFDSFEELFRVAVEEPQTFEKLYQYVVRRL